MRILKTVRLAVIVIGVVLLASPDGALANDLPPNETAPAGPGSMNEVRPLVTYTLEGDSAGDTANAVNWRCLAPTHNPHKSHHVTPNINVEAEIECNVVMAQLRVSVTLQKQKCIAFICWFTDYGPRAVEVRYLSSWVNVFSPAPCEDGTYRGFSYHYMLFPNGHLRTGYGYSRTVNITC